MVHSIRRIAPLQAAKVLSILYAVVGLLLLPLFLVPAMMGTDTGFGIGGAVALPFLYAAMGFVTTLIGCALYNLVAGWMGGIEIELT
jgi:hypothetical protein